MMPLAPDRSQASSGRHTPLSEKSAMSLQPGDTIEGKYRIVRLLGEGGMGAVYEGENVRIHRKVAIKVLHAAVAAKADVVQRFEREAQAAGRIGSEHIVEVLDLGNLPEGDRFMVMEYLDGESLGERIKRKKRLAPQEVGHLLHQLLEGLAAAHAAGIIHRDLKPDNVFLMNSKGNQKDFVKVLDFGVSKFNALDSEMSMTRTGAVMGTPFYMSPEQARGGKVDTRSDLYSVGVVIYQAVTGRVPFHAETFNELVFKIALESCEPAELVTPGLDPAFAALIVRAMVRDPAGRFQTAQEFQAAVGQWLMTAAPDGMGGVMNAPPGMRQSGPGFTLSNPNIISGIDLGVSGSAQGTSTPGLGQSSPGGGLSQTGGPLTASQNGLALTGPQPRKSGAMMAVGFLGVLVVAGGAFGAYRVFGGKPTVVPAGTTSVATSTPTVKATVAPTAVIPTVAMTAPTPPTAVVTATAAPIETAAPTARVGGPLVKTKPTSSPTATATAVVKTAPTGRVVGGDL
jgi:eukaryotic-like serine/threonine-protein kinase